jgi:hypothetical protein
MDANAHISLLYDRHERSDAIDLKYKHFPLLNVAIFIAAALSLISQGHWTNICMGSYGILLILWIVGMWRPTRELHSAMREHGILVSGSKLSFRNPLKVVANK